MLEGLKQWLIDVFLLWRELNEKYNEQAWRWLEKHGVKREKK